LKVIGRAKRSGSECRKQGDIIPEKIFRYFLDEIHCIYNFGVPKHKKMFIE
jgi:hypothetical protein